uniref:RING-type E3 ubiquitin transferase n=1 Tax=Davidia involucrata TaxID=16924 RepID=A0A5B7BP61_DAVIN
MGDNFERGGGPVSSYTSKGYALSGKIMLSAIVILFAVVVFMVCLHLYARWYLLQARRRQLRRRRTHIVFYTDPNATTTTVTASSPGLDISVLNSLPVFAYSSKTHPDSQECAVCLSEFEENEKGRLLPKCNHSFHIDCIDMWFLSHSTCPLCRSSVEPEISAQLPENRSDVVVSVGEPAENEPGSSSGLCSDCQHDEEQTSSSSLGSRRKALDRVGVTIEIPRRNESDDELGLSSPASQGFRSPGTRLLSLKRILSFNRKSAAVSPSSGIGTSCGYGATELDIERGRDESTPQTRAQTPR